MKKSQNKKLSKMSQEMTLTMKTMKMKEMKMAINRLKKLTIMVRA